MLNIYEGVPGSGKTYLAVTDLLKICEYDAFHERYRVKEGDCIISNIKDLKIDHVDLDKSIEKHGFSKFFHYDMFQTLASKYNRVVIVIDECQRYFTNKNVTQDVAYAFEYHRHAGIDIVLITQDARNLPRRLTALPEYIVSAKSRSVNLGFRFAYDFYDSKSRVHLRTTTLKKDQKVFRAYKSFEFDEGEKPKNAVLYWGAVTAIIFGVLVLALYYFFHNIVDINSSKNYTKNNIVEKVVAKESKPQIIPVVVPISPEPTPGPSYIYPITGIVGDNQVLLPNGLFFELPSKCSLGKRNFQIQCPMALTHLGKEIDPARLYSMINKNYGTPQIGESFYNKTIRYLDKIIEDKIKGGDIDDLQSP